MQSCNSCPRIDYTQFDRPPQIFITKQLDECNYAADINLTVRGKRVNSHGTLQFSKGIFLITIPEISSKPLPLFDLNRRTGEAYKVEYDSEDLKSRLSIDCKVDSIYTRNSGEVIHAFRLLNSFIQDEASGNIVFFVNQSHGIIGSYISINLPEDGSDYDEIFGPGEKYLDPRGDYLSDVIDYSKKSKVSIE
jgi:hypothetical protein